MDDSRTNLQARRGFTLTELLVAVVVLLVVILAVGRIFGTASQVVKSGEANAAVLQESAAIEYQLRKDLASASAEGFLVINCTAVRNDINLGSGGPLLDPRRRTDEWLRCDQVVFLTDASAISQQGSGFDLFQELSNGTYPGDFGPVPQSTLSRVYYGHGVQFPYLPQNEKGLVRWYQNENSRTEIAPWFRPNPSNAMVDFSRWPNLGSTVGNFNGAQPDATDWTLARQELLIADDQADVFGDSAGYGNGDERYYLGASTARVNSAATRAQEWDLYGLLGPDAATSRVDVVGADLARIQKSFDNYNPNTPPQSGALGNLLFQYWPRAEKRPVTLSQTDAMTTTSTLVGNCSSFQVEWTWADGTGSETDLASCFRGSRHDGGIWYDDCNFPDNPQMVTDPSFPTPWFGLGTGSADPWVTSATMHPDVVNYAPIGVASDISGPVSHEASALSVIENWNKNGDYIKRYTAIFGFNRDEPLVRDAAGNSIFDSNGNRLFRTDYTPWPSALRVSMVVHDSDGTIDGGRRIEFTVPLPRRMLDLPEE